MNKSPKTSSSNNNNIYDIISFYEDDDEPKHVTEVIRKIEKTNQRLKRDRWIKWKLFGCLIINVLLSAPIYSYGTLYLLQKPLFDAQPILVYPPIVFNSVCLIVTPWLFNSISTPASRSQVTGARISRLMAHADSSTFAKLTNKNVIIIFSAILSMSISVAGFTFSYLKANITLILIFYSIIGGMASCIVMGKLFVLINGILNNDRLHMINFLYSFGQALAQFIFPYLIQLQMKWICYNCTLLLIGAIMFHIIPLTMIIIENKISIHLRHKWNLNDSIDVIPIEESRYSAISGISFDFCADIKYPSDVYDMENKWKNPSHFKDENDGNTLKGDNFLEELDSHRVMNSEGVEILQTIKESDEEMEIKLPGKTANDEIDLTDDAIESIYEEINRKHVQHQQENKKSNNRSFFKKVCDKYHNTSTTFVRQIVNPLRQSLNIFKFYPSVILKSCDIFSYLLFITLILPNLALKQYRFEDRGKVIYLIMLMGLAWIIYALCIFLTHNRIKQNCIQYFHIAGLLGKFFGYLFTNQRYSMNGFVFGLVLISLGHANSFHLQEIMIRNLFHPRKWKHIRGSIYSFSGFLIFIYCIIFHYLHFNLTFVNFCNVFVLFNLSGIIVWLLTHYKSIIYIFSRY